jgi:hypothetical protein
MEPGTDKGATTFLPLELRVRIHQCYHTIDCTKKEENLDERRQKLFRYAQHLQEAPGFQVTLQVEAQQAMEDSF